MLLLQRVGITLIGLVIVIVLMGAGQVTSRSNNDPGVGSVAYFPNLSRFAASINYEEGFEEGPDFQSIDDAVAWIAERAPVGYVTLGSSSPVVFRVGDAARDDVDVGEVIRDWPPSPDELRRLVADMDAVYKTSIADNSSEFPDHAIIERDGS